MVFRLPLTEYTIVKFKKKEDFQGSFAFIRLETWEESSFYKWHLQVFVKLFCIKLKLAFKEITI